jgi:hypothetical protein
MSNLLGTKVQSLDFLGVNSRYNMHQNITFYFNKLMFDIPYKLNYDKNMLDVSSNLVINAIYNNRLDTVAWEKYGQSKYWWIVSQFNAIPNPLNVAINSVIKLPNLESMIMNGILK